MHQLASFAAILGVTGGSAPVHLSTVAHQGLNAAADCRRPPLGISFRKISSAPRPAFPAILSWRQPLAPAATIRFSSAIEATGTEARAIAGFVLGRVFVGPCDYALTKSADGYYLADGRTTPPQGNGNLALAGEAEVQRVAYLSTDEAGTPTDIVLRRAARGSTLSVCGRDAEPAQSCRLLATLARPVSSIRYLASPDTLAGTLGVVEEAPNGRRYLVDVDLQPVAKLR